MQWLLIEIIMCSDCLYKLLWAVIAYIDYYAQWLLTEVIMSSACWEKLLWAIIAYEVIMSSDCL